MRERSITEMMVLNSLVGECNSCADTARRYWVQAWEAREVWEVVENPSGYRAFCLRESSHFYARAQTMRERAIDMIGR